MATCVGLMIRLPSVNRTHAMLKCTRGAMRRNPGRIGNLALLPACPVTASREELTRVVSPGFREITGYLPLP